jgi:hypothetical protein
MKLNEIKFHHSSARLIAVAALAVSLISAPLLAGAAERLGHEDRAAMRVKQMHDRLMIADAQEAQWGKVAQTMNDNAKTMDKLTQARIDHAKDMTAVDDLKSYGEITEAHAEGIRTLTPVFATLYASMSDPQKKQADMMFRHGDRRGDRHGMYKNRHHKRGPNLPPAN